MLDIFWPIDIPTCVKYKIVLGSLIILIMFQTIIYDYNTFFMRCHSAMIFPVNLRLKIIILKFFKVIILLNPASDSIPWSNYVFNGNIYKRPSTAKYTSTTCCLTSLVYFASCGLKLKQLSPNDWYIFIHVIFSFHRYSNRE